MPVENLSGLRGAITTRLATFLPVVLGTLLVIGMADALVLALQFWIPGHIPDDTTSGVWTALAFDYSTGHLYRPLVSELGYGGTRYMPIYFMYIGTLIWLGLAPILAGLVAMQSTVLLMIAGIAWVLRRAGVSTGWAISIALVTYCTTLFQSYVTETNCEYLAAAFSLLAFAAYLQPKGQTPGPARLLLVALLCSLGFFTKLTTLYVPAAVFLHLLLTRQWRNAAIFAGAGLLMLGAFFLWFQYLSRGLMWMNMASAITGGTSIDYVLGFFGRFLRGVVISNPAIGITALMALGAWLVELRNEGASPFSLVFLMASLSTVLTFTSRGIDQNHVIAFHAFSLVMIGKGLSSLPLRASYTIGFGILTIISLITLVPGIASPRAALNLSERATVDQLVSAISRLRTDHRPVASNDSAVPSLFGERAAVLDDYNLWIAVTNNPAMAADLQRRLAAREFSVIAVRDSTVLEDGSYIEAARVGHFRLLVRRPQ